MSHFEVVQQFENGIKSSHSLAKGLAKVFAGLLSSVSSYALKRKLAERLRALTPKILELRKKQYGVLIRVDIDTILHIETGTQTPMLQSVAIVASGPDYASARRVADRTDFMKPSICPLRPTPHCKRITGYLWSTAFGMEIY